MCFVNTKLTKPGKAFRFFCYNIPCTFETSCVGVRKTIYRYKGQICGWKLKRSVEKVNFGSKTVYESNCLQIIERAMGGNHGKFAKKFEKI